MSSQPPTKAEILAVIDKVLSGWAAAQPVPEWATDAAKEEARKANLAACFGVRIVRSDIQKLFEERGL